MADTIVKTASNIREVTGIVLNTDDKIGRPYRVFMVDQFGPFFEYHSAESFLQLVAEEIAGPKDEICGSGVNHVLIMGIA